ncbi:shikimate dehydrogenase [Cyanobium sp. Morenito 9A2]|uniref:shikimate dehydrogenase n=1 Tax=Cyanobium sp. Morenito 9A2 TaxID=2823718 RepID=UPI0020CF9798|nr:shikimate dehydrogenase [Cyanobium sp. Morenito 9A2]MCP9850334.1 shikimate dehydrogenase [Cyanobium sp. Morenito 9A2]
MPPTIDGATALVGVLGDPVRHSLSPLMHNAALEDLGLNWAYLALPTPAAALAAVLHALEAIDCRGLNITLPHKQAAAALATELSPLAGRLGAVNTLVRRAEGGWFGTNTDVEGFLAPLRDDNARDATVDWQGRRALVLGCGGSARAVVAGCAELALERITVAGRRPQSLEPFVASCRPWAPGLRALTWNGTGVGPQGDPLAAALAQADLVVNTTPVGMVAQGNPAAAHRCPLGPGQLDHLRPGTVVYDLIYTPRPTRLLQEAAARGCRALDGLEMLVQQGAAALRLWSGQPQVPVATMRRAALTRLEGP